MKNPFNRSVQRTTGRRSGGRAARLSFWLILILSGLYGLVYVVNSWFNENKIIFQSPVTISFNKPVQIVKRELLVPTVIQVVEALPELKNLTPIEKYICDKWGALDCRVALAVARAESNMNCQAINVNTNGSVDFSIFQVNSLWLKNYSLQDIVDCYKNVDIAYEIWDRADGTPNNKIGNFTPWVAFKNGAFIEKL